MLLWGFNFFCGGKEKLSIYTNAAMCGGENASSFAIFSIANVLAFVRQIGRHYATFILFNLVVGEHP